MIKHDIHCRYMGVPKFTAEIDCDENASPSLKMGLAALWGINNGFNLRTAYLPLADLRDADLRGVDLTCADLSGADLSGADLSDAIINGASLYNARFRDTKMNGTYLKNTPIEIFGLGFHIFIFDTHMKIECEFHSLSDWESFDKVKIYKMDGKDGWDFWKENKPHILGLARAAGRTF